MQWVTEGHLTRVIHSSPLWRQRILSSYQSFQTFTSLYYNIISLPTSTPKAAIHQQKATWPCHSPVSSAITHCSFQNCPNPQQHRGSFLGLRVSLQAPLSLHPTRCPRHVPEHTRPSSLHHLWQCCPPLTGQAPIYLPNAGISITSFRKSSLISSV